MRKTQGVAFTALLALSLLVSGTNAFARNAKAGRGTAWTDLGPLPIPSGVTRETSPLEPAGVTWE